MKALSMLIATATVCLLVLYFYAPMLLADLIKHFDMSDVILGTVIMIMSGIIIWQERKLRQRKNSSPLEGEGNEASFLSKKVSEVGEG
jgi:uncharacterized membrane protein YccC